MFCFCENPSSFGAIFEQFVGVFEALHSFCFRSRVRVENWSICDSIVSVKKVIS